MAGWCPYDRGQLKLKPLKEMSALEARRLFGGLPAWQLSYWTCMAGAIPEAVRRQALEWPVDHFWRALDAHHARQTKPSMLEEGGDQYVPVPGIEDVVMAAEVEEGAEAGPASGTPASPASPDAGTSPASPARPRARRQAAASSAPPAAGAARPDRSAR